MASEIERVWVEATAPLGGASRVAAMVDELRALQGQFLQLQTIQEAVVESLQREVAGGQSGTDARSAWPVASPTASSSSSPKAGGSSGVGSPLLGFLGPGLLLGPLISGVLKLFGGGGSSEPPPLLKFQLPPAVNVHAGVSKGMPGTAFGVDSAQGGLPRPVVERAAPQITVQVQAMDSQSFLDHSGDIARAVRQAMLESSILNDVVREA